eukprot:7351515-Prymnesium_polylepis.1
MRREECTSRLPRLARGRLRYAPSSLLRCTARPAQLVERPGRALQRSTCPLSRTPPCLPLARSAARAARLGHGRGRRWRASEARPRVHSRASSEAT